MLETRASDNVMKAGELVHLGKQAPSHLPAGALGNPFVGNKQVDFLIDTGATCSVLNTGFARSWTHRVNPEKCFGKRIIQKASPKTVFAIPRLSD